LAKLTSLEVLKIGGDVLQVDYVDGELSMIKNVPSEVLYKGLKAVQQYLGDLQEGSTPCFLLKCVVVGNQRSGKSSVVDSLVGNTHKLRHDNDRTVGIDVRRWVLKQNVVNNRQEVSKSLLVNFYDSGGHLVYRSTHGLFMRGDPLFLNMVRSDVGPDEALDHLEYEALVAIREDEALEALVAWVEEIHQQMLSQKVRYSPKIGLVFTVTGEKNTLELNHDRVLQRLRKEMDSQAESVDSAMRKLEVIFEDNIQSNGSLCGEWVTLRNNRDDKLTLLDEYALKVHIGRPLEVQRWIDLLSLLFARPNPTLLSTIRRWKRRRRQQRPFLKYI
jgi:GTPase SAR1 family protein